MKPHKRRLLVSHMRSISMNSLPRSKRKQWYLHVSAKWLTLYMASTYPHDELLAIVEEELQVAKLEGLLDE